MHMQVRRLKIDRILFKIDFRKRIDKNCLNLLTIFGNKKYCLSIVIDIILQKAELTLN